MRPQLLSATVVAVFAGLFIGSFLGFAGKLQAKTLQEQNEDLYKKIQEVHQLSDTQMKEIRVIFEASGYIGQGNPEVTKHPFTPEQCQEKLTAAKIDYANPAFEKICSGKYMAPLYDPSKDKPETAKACIDQFEFPSIPCEYPVVWVRAKEAAEICQVMGKRMCDAHEWEGACAGSLEAPDYDFAVAKGVSEAEGFRRLRDAHNKRHSGDKVWAYGKQFQKGICSQASKKSPNCDGGNWKDCGSNTYPVGYSPGCKSTLDVYDIHGNAAEHMNLPLDESQMASKGSLKLGQTEMKGSWFIWDTYYAHQDSCRWRAPYWHGSRVMSDHSHHNYHLGFRCCKDVGSK